MREVSNAGITTSIVICFSVSTRCTLRKRIENCHSIAEYDDPIENRIRSCKVDKLEDVRREGCNRSASVLPLRLAMSLTQRDVHPTELGESLPGRMSSQSTKPPTYATPRLSLAHCQSPCHLTRPDPARHTHRNQFGTPMGSQSAMVPKPASMAIRTYAPQAWAVSLRTATMMSRLLAAEFSGFIQMGILRNSL
jgi:hypothetical protein